MLTNKLNLPEPFLRAAEAAEYSKGDARYSVTELIKPARIGALQRYYAETIVEDVADAMPSLIGRMFHLMLEKAGAPATKAILEERLSTEVEGVRISGAMDHTILWTDGTLDDYKSCTVYKVTKGDKFEWEAQTNMYRWLRHLHGQSVDRLRVIAWMKDWAVSRLYADVKRPEEERLYPMHEIAVIEIPVWPLEKTEAYVRERVNAHRAADYIVQHEGPDSPNLDRCSDEDCWRDKVQWAVMREGRKTAIKKYNSKQEAEFVAAQEKKGYVEIRGGTYKRCVMYCPVGRANLCSQWEITKQEDPAASVVDTSVFD